MQTQWLVDVTSWQPTSSLWQRAMHLLSEDEARQVGQFMFTKDRKLALASRLLQRCIVHESFDVPTQDIEICRTPEKKPYWRRGKQDAPIYWNYNVSHHGSVVAISSDINRLVGVDVVNLSDRPNGNVSSTEFFKAFSSHFTGREWSFICAQENDEDARYRAFYLLWSLKEAFIKAVGIGLGFVLHRLEIVVSQPIPTDAKHYQSEATLYLDRCIATDWQLTSTLCDDGYHLVSVAKGPLSAMHQPYTSSIFPVTTLASPPEESCALHTPTKTWEQRELADLVGSLEHNTTSI